MKLEGLRVVDLSLFLPGPFLTQIMADHGAEIIKVEPPGEGEPGRHIGLSQDGHSVFYRNTHRGKKSVCVNLKHAAGRELVLALCDRADVVIEAFRPGVVTRLGVGPEVVRARNPKVVYCSIAAFGQSGPYRDLPAHDLATEALGGVVSLNLGQDGEPTLPHVPVADISASLFAFSGIMMALYRRQHTQQGDYIDISMHDAVLACTPNITGSVFVEKQAPVVKQQRSLGGAAFYNIYRTADDRHVVLGAQEIKFVRNLLQALGCPQFIALCEEGPGAHQQPLIDFLRATFLTRTRDEWESWFRGKDIGFAVVKNLREAFDDPQAQARDMRLVDSQGREHIGIVVKFIDEPGRVDFSLATKGEHNESVLRDLGYDESTIRQLYADGTLEC
jgi:crotonobetainyl-CoA:carnitine CoA-transferase CaiB-like acyl-CoA transferase